MFNFYLNWPYLDAQIKSIKQNEKYKLVIFKLISNNSKKIFINNYKKKKKKQNSKIQDF